jgi:hypothetical protein
MSEKPEKVAIKVITPTTGLEHAIDAAKAGELAIPQFLKILSESTVCVPLSEPRDESTGGIKPFFFNRDGVPTMLLLSDAGLVNHAEVPVAHWVELSMREVVGMLSPKYGFVLNPGFNLSFDMHPHELADIPLA